MKKIFFYIFIVLNFACNFNKALIHISSNTFILGDNIDMSISNLEPNTEYEIYLTKISLYKGKPTLSKAVFVSNEKGRIDIDKDKSIGGDFLGQDSLGLFYNMDTTINFPNCLKIEEEFTKDLNHAYRYLQVLRENKLVAFKEFALTIYDEDKIEHTHIEEGAIKLDLYKANKSQNIVLIFGGSEGNNESLKFHAEILASKGFNTAAISYFGSAKQGYILQKIPIERIDTSIMKIEKKFGKIEKLILMGTSKGAELSLLYASLRPKVSSVIAFAPSCVVWQSYIGVKKSSWTKNNKEIEFSSMPEAYKPEFSEGKATFRSLYSQGLKDDKYKGFIEVENIKGEILLFSGEEDLIWPASIMADSIYTRLQKNNFKYPFENYKFSNVGHFIGPMAYTRTKHYSNYAIGGSMKEVAYANLKTSEITINFLTNKFKTKK